MIVAAALIMIAVFGSFVLNADPTVKQFGVGLSVGVALAAVCVLVFTPAVLVLAGRGSWWLPVWLDRILPHLDVEGAGAKAESPVEALLQIGVPDVGPVAQLVEQRTFNPKVAGSIPARPIAHR